MPNVSFFAGASNVEITGGEFNIIKGDHIVYDQSRHSHFNNAFNSQNNVTLDSHNNNNKTYHDVDPRSRSASSRHPATPESKGRDPRDYFPTPSLHPMFHQHSPSNLPPASRSRLDDSFNVTNNFATNVMNDNNEIYGAPHPKDRKGRKRRDVKEKYSDSDSSEADAKVQQPANEDLAEQSPDSYLPYGGNQPLRGQALFQAHIANSRPNYASPYFHNQGPSRQNFAQVNPGDIQPMPMEIQALMGQLLTRVREETSGTGVQVPAPAQADNHRRAPVEDDGENASNATDGDDDEQPTRMEDPRDPRTVTNSMANLTLNEQLRPAFSSIESDPQAPQPVPPQFAATPTPPTHLNHRRVTSAQSLPPHLQNPCINGLPGVPVFPPLASPHFAPYSQQRQGQSFPSVHGIASASQPQPHPSASVQPGHSQYPQNPVQEAFGIRPEFIVDVPYNGGPRYTQINGNYTKVDQTVHTTAIASGNTTNNLTMGSYNKNITTSYEAPKKAQGPLRKLLGSKKK